MKELVTKLFSKQRPLFRANSALFVVINRKLSRIHDKSLLIRSAISAVTPTRNGEIQSVAILFTVVLMSNTINASNVT